MPTADIILVAYNRAALLRDTIESVLAQSYTDFLLTICDDASTDETEEVGRAYARRDGRVTYHRNEGNLGMPGNLDHGIARTAAPFVACLHDGDTYHPRLLEAWVDALDSCGNAGFVFNGYRALGDDGEEDRLFIEDLPRCFEGARLLEEICFRRWRFDSPVWGTAMFRRSAFEAVGGLDARFGFFADVDLWFRLAHRYRVAYVAEPLVNLAPRALAPRLFDSSDEASLIQAIHLEARQRHFAGRSIRLAVEVARHRSFQSAAQVYSILLRARRRVLSRAQSRTTELPHSSR